jgi:hypothetical protein
MRKTWTVIAIVVTMLSGSWAPAQQPTLPATTVQLPSFSYFTVNTAVSVPDRGGAYLGGVKSARDGYSARGLGPLANRGRGGDRAAKGVIVQATIIDLAELDEAVLTEAAAKRAGIDPTDAKAELLTRQIARGSSSPTDRTGGLSAQTIESVAAIRARKAAAAAAQAGEAAGYLIQAQQAEAEGKPGVAKIYYQMVARRDTGELKRQAEARLAAIGGKAGAVAKR